MTAAFFITSSSDNPDGLDSRSIRAFFSASSLARLRISSEALSASANAIFSINALALGTVDRSSVAVIASSPLGLVAPSGEPDRPPGVVTTTNETHSPQQIAPRENLAVGRQVKPASVWTPTV